MREKKCVLEIGVRQETGDVIVTFPLRGSGKGSLLTSGALVDDVVKDTDVVGKKGVLVLACDSDPDKVLKIMRKIGFSDVVISGHAQHYWPQESVHPNFSQQQEDGMAGIKDVTGRNHPGLLRLSVDKSVCRAENLGDLRTILTDLDPSFIASEDDGGECFFIMTSLAEINPQLRMWDFERAVMIPQ
ncbi:MAG: hypothetical protein WC823_00530 [Parcubacteria group bacterium]|jgi:hypothetical protein